MDLNAFLRFAYFISFFCVLKRSALKAFWVFKKFWILGRLPLIWRLVIMLRNWVQCLLKIVGLSTERHLEFQSSLVLLLKHIFTRADFDTCPQPPVWLHLQQELIRDHIRLTRDRGARFNRSISPSTEILVVLIIKSWLIYVVYCVF